MFNHSLPTLRRAAVAATVLAAFGGGHVAASTVPPAGSDAHDGHAHAHDEGHAGDGHVEDRGAHGHGHGDGTLRRLVVASAEPELLFIDLDEGGARHVVTLQSPAGLASGVTEPGRFVLAAAVDGVTVVDGGVWSEPHGDHGHDHVEEPAIVGVVAGDRPTHLLSHGGTTALWFDGSGQALLFDEAGFAAGEIGVPRHHRAASGPHHGFVVPLGEHVVSTEMGADDAEMPGTVVVADAAGELLAEFECADTHGEAVWSGGAAAACADGVLVIAEGPDGWTGSLVAYPGVDDTDPYGYGDARAWMLTTSPDGSVLAASLGAHHVLLVDPADGSAVAVELDAPTAMFGVVFADDALLALDGDGVLHEIDPATGAITGTIVDVVSPFADGEGGVYVVAVVTGETVYVTDPAAVAVAVVDLHTGATLEPLALDVAPTALAVVGPA